MNKIIVDFKVNINQTIQKKLGNKNENANYILMRKGTF